MNLLLFFRGVLFGLAIAAPVGPIGLLCMQRTVQHGHLAGFVSGLGAASADALYGLVAAFGLTLVVDFLLAQQNWLQLVGGVLLLWLGVRTLWARPATEAAFAAPGKTLPTMYASTLLLTLANPVTVVMFTAVFGGFGLGETGLAPLAPLALVAGVFTGSALWWLFLSVGVSLLTRQLRPAHLRAINVAAGLLLLGMGLLLLWR